MRGLILTLVIVQSLAMEAETVWKQDREVFVRNPNYDEGKVSPYALEDPLTFADGRKVATAADWAKRRQEILGIFAREMYGEEPPKPESLNIELLDEKRDAEAGYAIRRQYRMGFGSGRLGPGINWICWVPRHARQKVPVIVFLNFYGNHELVVDPDIRLTEAWGRNSSKHGYSNHRLTEPQRGWMQRPDSSTKFPLDMILARGYAVVSACYGEVSPDPDGSEESPDFQQNPFAYTGVFSLWGERDTNRTDNITALGAWAWALSRGLDLAERIPEIDATKSVVTGCSRLGKAALLAGARDERFAVVVPNQTGGGGATLAKRDFGENVSTENRMFTHWYCLAYAKYAEKPWESLTFDQHLLLACVAPRALMVQGWWSEWFDPKGEFLALQAASPVWRFLGKTGLPDVAWPDEYDESAIGRDVAYVRRSEWHGIAACDWNWLLNFADCVLNER